MLPELLDQIPPEQKIASVTTDGAFYTRKCHDAIAARGAAAIIPPPQEREALEARHLRGHRTKRDSTDIEARRSNHLATMERISPPEPCRDQDALCETARAAPVRPELRPSGRRVPRPRRRPRRRRQGRDLSAVPVPPGLRRGGDLHLGSADRPAGSGAPEARG
ncbi:transposase [Cereibacter sphaeroides]|uniref:transposase n=1 Tax=Cereibacter sphaeroides TaxID=1063 RepID=UPI003B5CD3B3